MLTVKKHSPATLLYTGMQLNRKFRKEYIQYIEVILNG